MTNAYAPSGGTRVRYITIYSTCSMHVATKMDIRGGPFFCPLNIMPDQWRVVSYSKKLSEGERILLFFLLFFRLVLLRPSAEKRVQMKVCIYQISIVARTGGG